MAIWEALLLGVVQGLTEFLPISSTAHLLFVRTLLGHPKPEDAFTTVIQLGTLFAVVVYFRWDIARLAKGLLVDARSFRVGSTAAGRMAWLIILGTVPVVLVGLTLKTVLKTYFFNLPAVAVVATVFALLLAAAEWWARRRVVLGKAARGEWEVGWRDAVWVGCWQALALMPGASRSGTTISAGLFAGLARPAAARFSFLLSLPAILAAGVKEFWDDRHTIVASGDQAAALAVGLITSAAVGYVAIAWLLHFLKRYTTTVFVVYRLVLGAVILGLLVTGRVPTPEKPPAGAGGESPAGGAEWVAVRGKVVLPAGRPVPERAADDDGPDLPSLLSDDVSVHPQTRGVRNVVVWLSPSATDPFAPFDAKQLNPADAARPAREHAVTADRSRYVPRVLTARPGDTLAFKQGSGGAVSPVVSGPRNGQWAAEEGKPLKTWPLAWERGPVAVTCANSPWRRAWVRVFDHPYHAVTDADGNFEIPGAPAGRSWLWAWHEAKGVRPPEPLDVRDAGKGAADAKPVEFDVTR